MPPATGRVEPCCHLVHGACASLTTATGASSCPLIFERWTCPWTRSAKRRARRLQNQAEKNMGFSRFVRRLCPMDTDSVHRKIRKTWAGQQRVRVRILGGRQQDDAVLLSVVSVWIPVGVGQLVSLHDRMGRILLAANVDFLAGTPIGFTDRVIAV